MRIKNLERDLGWILETVFTGVAIVIGPFMALALLAYVSDTARLLLDRVRRPVNEILVKIGFGLFLASVIILALRWLDRRVDFRRYNHLVEYHPLLARLFWFGSHRFLGSRERSAEAAAFVRPFEVDELDPRDVLQHPHAKRIRPRRKEMRVRAGEHVRNEGSRRFKSAPLRQAVRIFCLHFGEG
jgi:hypothetical protein